MQPQKEQVSEYFKDLQKEVKEERGKRNQLYNLAFILCSVLLGIMSGRRSRSELYRYLKNRFGYLKEVTGYEEIGIISDRQFRRVLRGVDWSSYNEVNRRHFGKELVHLKKEEWVALDGKELRGSIATGIDGKKEKRGEAVVNAVKHKGKEVLATTYYRGDKESERPAVRDLLESSSLKNKSVTLDALHCDPTTTSLVEQAKGQYIIQVKDNQELLLKDLEKIPCFMPLLNNQESLEKAHGRIEYRKANFYSLEQEVFDKRWNKSGFRTLAKVYRKTTIVKSGELREETSYYICNKSMQNESEQIGENLFEAIRGHWSVEADNYVRDVTFGEDKIKTPKGNVSRVLANIRTWAIQLIRETGAKNLKEQIEEFNDCPNKLTEFLKFIKLAGP